MERQSADILHLTRQCSPEAFNRLVIAWCAGAGHALTEPILLYKLFGFQCRILTTPVTVENWRFRAVGISPYRHAESILNQYLGLAFANGPAHHSSGGYIQYPAQIQLAGAVSQLCYIRTPQRIGLFYREFIPNQILFQVLRFL